MGLIIIFIGLFITLGSVFHNHLMFWVNSTSHGVYGPYDVTAGMMGAGILLVGVIVLILSYRGKTAEVRTPAKEIP